MSFRLLKYYRPVIVAPSVYLPEVQHNEKGEVVIAMVCQSKDLPDSSTSKISSQIAAGVPLKKMSTVMMRDVSGLPANLQDALDADADFNSKQSQSQPQTQNDKKED